MRRRCPGRRPHAAGLPGHGRGDVVAILRHSLRWANLRAELPNAAAGRTCSRRAGTGHAAGQPAAAHILAHVLVALAAVIALGRLLGGTAAARRPAAGHRRSAGRHSAGSVAVGLVRPRLPPRPCCPPRSPPYLGMLAQIGVIFYMFVVGMEFDAGLLAQRGHAALAISHASILAPFLERRAVGTGDLSAASRRRVSASRAFALFLGVAMSITAFPVLARILTDRGLNRTPLGMLALCCAAVDDVTAWCLLAVVVGVATAQAGSVLVVIALAIAIRRADAAGRAAALGAIRRAAAGERGRAAGLSTIFVALLLSAAATEWIGIHAIFGGFLLGVIIPHESGSGPQPGRAAQFAGHHAVAAGFLRLYRHADRNRAALRCLGCGCGAG